MIIIRIKIDATVDSVVFSQQESLSQSQSQQELMSDPLFFQSTGITTEALDTVSDLTDLNAVLTEFNKLVKNLKLCHILRRLYKNSRSPLMSCCLFTDQQARVVSPV